MVAYNPQIRREGVCRKPYIVVGLNRRRDKISLHQQYYLVYIKVQSYTTYTTSEWWSSKVGS